VSAAGRRHRTAGGSTKTLVEHWNGTKWSVVASPNVAKTGGQTAANQLRGVAARSDPCRIDPRVGGPGNRQRR
jgi:hypothetical protein